MKDNSSKIQKSESDNKIHEKKLISYSPKKSEKNIFDEMLLSPEKRQMNQKFFPSKENFFGTKASPIRSISPKAHSPILNYYAGLSPQEPEITYYSPKSKKESFIKFNRNSSKVSPNFNTSPSAIFNVESSNKNSNIQREEDTIPLQEKMAPYVKMESISSNLNKNININMNLKEENNVTDGENEDEEDDEDGHGAFILSFHVDDKNNAENAEQGQNNIKKNLNPNSNLNNINNNINENENILSDQNIVKNIINKSEYTPYIPNKLRNIQNDMSSYFNIDNNNNNYNYLNNNIGPIPQNFNNINPNMNNINQLNITETPNIINDINNNNNNINFIENIQEQNEIQNDSHSFYYNGDNYQISNTKEYKKEDYSKTGKIPSITPSDIVITITSNNKVIKRINPNVYLNESVEFLAYNIFPLAQDQAGCRYLQEMVEKDPINTVPKFFKSLMIYLIPLIKDPFGNYFVQKLFPHLTPNDLKTFLEKIENNIFDLGSNHHGTRVIQNIIYYLKTPELVNKFFNMIKPHIIPLLKEMHGAHIINKLSNLHSEYSNEIYKVIVDNCCSLATHKHGCCFLQKILESPDSPMKNDLIKNLIDNIFVLIIDQFGNYVIQSILFLNNNKYSSDIALKIADSAPYYSKHRYSSNVIEKCFDFCAKKERSVLIDKLYAPETISDLILDEHGNYVIQKALYYADFEKKEEMLKTVRPLIPKIRNSSFGEKLLNRLFSMYPKLNNNRNINDERNNGNKFQYNWNNYNNNNNNNINNNYNNNNNSNSNSNNNYNYNYNNRNRKYNYNYNNNKDGYQKKNNYNYNNMNNNYINRFNNNNFESNSSNINNVNNNDIDNNIDSNNNTHDINKNVSLNKYFNINNNTINININSNQDEKEDNKIIEDKKINEINFNNNNHAENESQKKFKKKKGRKSRKTTEE